MSTAATTPQGRAQRQKVRGHPGPGWHTPAPVLTADHSVTGPTEKALTNAQLMRMTYPDTQNDTPKKAVKEKNVYSS